MNPQETNFVEIKRVTWTKDSHNLFDYESKSVTVNQDKIELSSNVYIDTNNNNNIAITPINNSNHAQDTNEDNYLFSIIGEGNKNEKFTLKIPPIYSYDSAKQNLFLIVRSLKHENGNQRGYTLELGDVLRLGRIEYKVIEYQDNTEKRHSLFDLEDSNILKTHNLSVKTIKKDIPEHQQCRICLREKYETPERLINPCICKGTSEFVHITCLQSWINSKVKNKTTSESSCWYWKNLNCEVCKTSLPDLMDTEESNDRYLRTIGIHRPKTPYMLLERIFYDRSKGDNSKILILLSIKNETHKIQLGRGNDCDLRENDISVSRLHALMKYENSKFKIFDNNSKFGTLIFLRKGFDIERKKIALQMGRTVITFSCKQNKASTKVEHMDPLFLEHSLKENKAKTNFSEGGVGNPLLKDSNKEGTKEAKALIK